MRLFVALDLPESWKVALGGLQDAMRAAIRERFGDSVRVRWVRPEGIHLTLKFLGETPEERVEALKTALAQAVPSSPGFALELARAGAFSDRRAPRVVIATVADESRGLQPLHEHIETWLAAAGWPRERRWFQPHLTLARLPETLDDATRQEIAALTGAVKAPEAPKWAVEGVYLIRSRLGPGGARYESLAAFPSET
jgi:RNA 2',3'-cyclic 3'-phosphodiesterase